MPGNFVRSALLSGAEELIRELGARPRPIARRAGVPAEALRDPDIPLPGRCAYAFLECAARECRCPAFGLRLGARARMAAVIGPLWVLLRNAQNLRQMFEDLAANFDVYTSVATVAVEPAAGGMLLSWSSTAGQTESDVQMAGFALAVFCQEVRRQVAPGWQSQSVTFRHAAPRSLAEHHRWLGRNIAFDRDRHSVFIERALLERSLGGGAARTRALVGSLLRRNEDAPDASAAARVEAVVRSLLPFAPCTVQEVSRAMGWPVRTLQHRLQAGARSFKDIKDAVRADLALKYLRHSGLDLAEIAEILGYSELSAFSRSFRRWHGRTARSVRREASRE